MSQDNPFAAPEANPSWGRRGAQFDYPPGAYVREFRRDPRRLTKFLVALLGIGVVIVGISSIFDIMEHSILTQDEITLEQAESNDLRQGIIGLIQSWWYILTAIIFLKWIYRASLNAHGFGARHLKFTPGWSIGWYFVPIFTLFRPYQAMKEIWRASHDPIHWENYPGSPLLGWWWFFWLATNIVGQISFKAAGAAHDLDSQLIATKLGLAGDFSLVLVTIFAIFLVQSICQAQVAWVEGDEEQHVANEGPGPKFDL